MRDWKESFVGVTTSVCRPKGSIPTTKMVQSHGAMLAKSIGPYKNSGDRPRMAQSTSSNPKHTLEGMCGNPQTVRIWAVPGCWLVAPTARQSVRKSFVKTPRCHDATMGRATLGLPEARDAPAGPVSPGAGFLKVELLESPQEI
jgi:hypothetical protein